MNDLIIYPSGQIIFLIICSFIVGFLLAAILMSLTMWETIKQVKKDNQLIKEFLREKSMNDLMEKLKPFHQKVSWKGEVQSEFNPNDK